MRNVSIRYQLTSVLDNIGINQYYSQYFECLTTIIKLPLGLIGFPTSLVSHSADNIVSTMYSIK
jgi:hypothetical protein